jgi:uncharacterized protein (DUF1501 family)
VTRTDPSTAEVVAHWSTPANPTHAQPGLSRRRFLQAAGVAGVATLLPAWLAEAAEAATPVGPNDGILVLLTMAGGNDGLNTFVPIADGAYYDARPNLAIRPDDAIHVSPTRGLHPQLGYMKALWDQGRVAAIEGVGQPDADLSHFVSMGRIMAANGNGQPGSSGWVGRFLDGLPHSPLNALSLGNRVPLVVQGRQARANAVPSDGGNIKRIDRTKPVEALQYDALLSMAGTSTGLGHWADAIQAEMGEAIHLADDLRPHLPGESDEPRVVQEMRLAANLINANVGIRVFSILWGDFDSHSGQVAQHGARMRELDDGLRAFFTTLNPSFANRTLILGTSEFGRRVADNNNGTDHGTANTLFAIGSRVNGGFHGQAPSLTDLTRGGNLKHTVDYRQVYGNVLSTWLGADAAQVVGANHSDLGFVTAPVPSSSTTVGRFPDAPVPLRAQRAEVARLYLAYFGRRPDDDGLDYWVGVRESGQTLAQISAAFAASDEFQARYGALSDRQFVELIYRNVMKRDGDPGGINYWRQQLGNGASRGQVMVGFSESAEFKTRTEGEVKTIDRTGPIGRLYRAYFGRDPDEAGLEHWINTGLDRSEVSAAFAESGEFRGRYGSLSNAEFVALVYRNVMGREPDAAGRNHWVGVLERGTPRSSVMLEFSDSPEFVRKMQG